MNQIDDQNATDLSATTQVTFKITRYEKRKIEQESSKLDMNTSEYCRIKVLSTEDDLVELRNEVNVQKKAIKILRTKLSFYKDTIRDENSITVQLTEEQRVVLELLVKSIGKKGLPLGEQLKDAFIHLATLEQIWSFFIEWHHLNPDDVSELFSPYRD